MGTDGLVVVVVLSTLARGADCTLSWLPRLGTIEELPNDALLVCSPAVFWFFASGAGEVVDVRGTLDSLRPQNENIREVFFPLLTSLLMVGDVSFSRMRQPAGISSITTSLFCFTAVSHAEESRATR